VNYHNPSRKINWQKIEDVLLSGAGDRKQRIILKRGDNVLKEGIKVLNLEAPRYAS
jgi:hypothetical protein